MQYYINNIRALNHQRWFFWQAPLRLKVKTGNPRMCVWSGKESNFRFCWDAQSSRILIACCYWHTMELWKGKISMCDFFFCCSWKNCSKMTSNLKLDLSLTCLVKQKTITRLLGLAERLINYSWRQGAGVIASLVPFLPADVYGCCYSKHFSFLSVTVVQICQPGFWFGVGWNLRSGLKYLSLVFSSNFIWNLEICHPLGLACS